MERTSSGSPSSTDRSVVPWNKGAFVGPKPPLKSKQVWSIRLNFQREKRIRDRAMFNLAIDSKLRGCDLVQLRIGQLVINAAARHSATIFFIRYSRWRQGNGVGYCWPRTVGMPG